MAGIGTISAQYLTKFGDQSIAGTQYALTKLGIEHSQCSIKIEKYMILCVPFQLGFKRSIFLASLSKQELVFFQKYHNSIVGLSISLNPDKRPEPVKFFLRCTLSTVGQMKGRDNVGLFVLDYKTSPDDLVSILGDFMETQEKLKTQYEDYGNKSIRITAHVAKAMGYNTYATVAHANAHARRIQVFSINSKSIEHMEAAGSPVLPPGTHVSYQLFFKKFRIAVNGTIVTAAPLPQGIIRSMASLEFSPGLVEVMDDYWYSTWGNSPEKPPVRG